MIEIICLTFATLAAFTFLMKYFGSHRRLQCLPTGLRTLPMLGHLQHLLFQGRDMNSITVNVAETLSSIRDGLFCWWMGPHPTVFIKDPEYIQVVLNSSKTLGRSEHYKLLKFLGGDGIFTGDVFSWKIKRKYMLTLFHPKNLDQLIPTYNQTSKMLVTKLLSEIRIGEINIFNQLYELSLRNLLALMYGPTLEVDMKSSDFQNLKTAVKIATALNSERLINIWYKWDLIFNFVCRKELKFVRKSFEYPVPSVDHVEDSENTHVTLQGVYRRLLQKHPHFYERDLQFEKNTILVAGTEPVAAVLSTCLVALACHPHIQDRLYKEIIDVIDPNVSAVTYEDIRNLKYLDCVLKETLRRFPNLPFFTRSSDAEMKLGEWTLPPGTDISVNIQALHKDPRLFPNPERFDPDRFLDENVAQRHKYAFLPFSGGPRDCIGKQYALLMMKITLVYLVRAFTFTTTTELSKIEYKYNTLLVFKGGYNVELQARK